MRDLTQQEKLLVKLTQNGLPLHHRPFKVIAEQVGASEDEVIRRFQKMKQEGLIRRIAITPNHYALGYQFNLMTVWDVDDIDIDQVGELVARFGFVSHCYQRPRNLPDWPFNMFAMIHAKSRLCAKKQVELLKVELEGKFRQYAILKSSKILKKTGLRI